MDIHFVKAVLTPPDDHPRWETDLLAQLTDIPSHETMAAPTAAAKGRGDEHRLWVGLHQRASSHG
jgi:hypothetical protein